MDRRLDFLRGHTLSVYSSHGCPDCTRLDRWMKEQSVAHEKVFIDEVPGAADKLESETGKQAVPFVLVDGRTWVRGYHKEIRGRFDEAVLLAELREAVGSPQS
jgi:glutaredoxin